MRLKFFETDTEVSSRPNFSRLVRIISKNEKSLVTRCNIDNLSLALDVLLHLKVKNNENDNSINAPVVRHHDEDSFQNGKKPGWLPTMPISTLLEQ